MGGQIHGPAALPPKKRSNTHRTGSFLGLEADLDDCEKPPPPPGFDPCNVQTLASPSSDYAIPHVLNRLRYSNKFNVLLIYFKKNFNRGVKWTLEKYDVEFVELIDLAQDTDKGGSLVNAILNSQIP